MFTQKRKKSRFRDHNHYFTRFFFCDNVVILSRNVDDRKLTNDSSDDRKNESS